MKTLRKYSAVLMTLAALIGTLTLTALFAAQSAAVPDEQITIGDFYVTATSKSGLRDYIYTVEAKATNNGADAYNVSATLVDLPSNVAVIDGALTFGKVPAGATVKSTDTFEIKVTGAFSASLLKFKVSYDLPVLTGIEIASLPTKTVYTEGDSLNLDGLTVRAIYSHGDPALVSGYATNLKDGAILSAAGTISVAVSYEGKTTGFSITVTKNADVLMSLTRTTATLAEAGNQFSADSGVYAVISNLTAWNNNAQIVIGGTGRTPVVINNAAVNNNIYPIENNSFPKKSSTLSLNNSPTNPTGIIESKSFETIFVSSFHLKANNPLNKPKISVHKTIIVLNTVAICTKMAKARFSSPDMPKKVPAMAK